MNDLIGFRLSMQLPVNSYALLILYLLHHLQSSVTKFTAQRFRNIGIYIDIYFRCKHSTVRFLIKLLVSPMYGNFQDETLTNSLGEFQRHILNIWHNHPLEVQLKIHLK